MSSTAKVWVDKNTKVICQGFTGKQVGLGCGGQLLAVGCLVFLFLLIESLAMCLESMG